MKQKVAGVFLLVVIIIISIWGVNQYIDKQRYESYLSVQVANNIATLISSVMINQQLYNDIIRLNTISLEQVITLYENNYSIVGITQDYQNLAIDLNRIDRDVINNLPANNASHIAYFFYLLIWEIAEGEGLQVENRTHQFPFELSQTNEFDIEESKVEKIERIKELNELWITSLLDNVIGIADNGELNPDVYFDTYRNDAIISEYWVNIVTEMDGYTENYLLDNNYLDNIGTILY